MKTSLSILLIAGFFFLLLCKNFTVNELLFVGNPPVLVYPPIKVSDKNVKINTHLKKKLVSENPPVIVYPPIQVPTNNKISLIKGNNIILAENPPVIIYPPFKGKDKRPSIIIPTRKRRALAV